MPDDMMLSRDNKSLRRGNRRAPRTETCRPCLVWPKEVPGDINQGVIININPYGMCIRMLEPLGPGTPVVVQLMRDEEFRVPLSAPVEGMVVRNADVPDGFMDHGIELLQRVLERKETRYIPVSSRNRGNARGPSRMHTIDFRIGDRGIKRTER
ncbi:MAG TPA: hypothetical protein PLJ47_06890 [Candidatus Hydrogenedentes bacterium]|nr:hypothetical protein [Candidatus Hydrogenedentota bacterium]